jgi:hypothetical protein
MDRVERRLSACSTWLSYSGRLEMVNSSITPITTYAMCTIKLPKGVIENIDRARKQCLWRGNDANRKKGGNLVAWEVVMQPKEKGGLGVLNLRLQNDALLMKHLSKFYNHANIPWVQLIWNKYSSSKVPHAAREVGHFGGKIYSGSTPSSETFPNVNWEMAPLFVFGMISGLIQYLLRHTQD